MEAISQAAGRCNREGKLPYGKVVVFRPPLEDEKYPNTAYQKAALEVCIFKENIGPLDIGDPEIVRMYYQRYFLDNLHYYESQQLTDAIHAYNFEKTSRCYRWIADVSVNILVPYIPQLELYEELCALARQGNFNREWLKRARILGVSQRISAKSPLRDYLEPVKDCRGEATNWYILLSPDAYSQQTGLDISTSVDAWLV